MTDPIASFDDQPVYKAAVEVRNLGGGFRDAMNIDPAVMQSDDRVYFICEAVVGDIDHSRIDKENISAGWTRVHVLRATAVTFVDKQLVEDALTTHKARVEAFQDQHSGQQRMDGAKLDLDHFDGQHAEALMVGCPSCDKERDLIDEERKSDVAAIPISKGRRKVKDAPQA